MAYWMCQPYQEFSFEADTGKFTGDLYFGRQIIPSNLPTEITQMGGRKRIPDIFAVQSMIWGVTAKARDVLARAAPRDIEFYPITVKHGKSNSCVPGQFYFMNVVTQRDSVIWDKTNLEVRPQAAGVGEGVIVHMNFSPTTHIALKKDKIGSAQAWHERMQGSLSASEIFISDTLKSALDAAMLTPDSCLHVEEI